MRLSLTDVWMFAPALLAGLLVVATHVPLGRQVLQRGIIFIDLAIAQIAALGVIVAYVLGNTESPWVLQAAAVTAALGGALALHATERRWPQVQEANIGVAFVLAATAVILLLSQDPHGGERLQEMLVGQILWVTWPDVGPAAAVYGVVLTLMWVLRERLGRLGFYLLFALSVTVSVQLVGLYLVFATLIIPALATRQRSGARALGRGYLIGALGYAIGFCVSTALDLPASAIIVWMLAAVALPLAYRCR